MIIPVRNGAATLEQQLDALSAQTYDGAWEVVVADNGSDDGSPAVARAKSDGLPDLRVIDAPGRGGASRARNAGAAAANGQFLVYCDADDVADRGWLAAMVDAAADSELVGGRLDDTLLNDPVVRAWRPAPHVGGGLPRPGGFLPLSASANIGIWRDVLVDLGGWPDEYVGGHEDTALCWRAQLAGHRLVYAPDAVMGYRYRAGLGALARQAYRYGFMSARLYREFKAQGMPRSRPRVAVGAFARTVLELPRLRDAVGRGQWLYRLAFHSGRLVGSVRHRVVFL